MKTEMQKQMECQIHELLRRAQHILNLPEHREAHIEMDIDTFGSSAEPEAHVSTTWGPVMNENALAGCRLSEAFKTLAESLTTGDTKVWYVSTVTDDPDRFFRKVIRYTFYAAPVF